MRHQDHFIDNLVSLVLSVKRPEVAVVSLVNSCCLKVDQSYDRILVSVIPKSHSLVGHNDIVSIDNESIDSIFGIGHIETSLPVPA